MKEKDCCFEFDSEGNEKFILSLNPLNKCPLCDEGLLYPVFERRKVKHMGVEGEVSLYYSVCTVCGNQLAGYEESVENARVMKMFKEKIASKYFNVDP